MKISDDSYFRGLVALLALFIPLMFTFSKSLVDSIQGKRQCDCDERRNIVRFNAWSGIYLQCFAFFVIFELLKMTTYINHEILNVVYLGIFLGYVLLEDWRGGIDREDELLMLTVTALFCFFPLLIWIMASVVYSNDTEEIRSKFSFIMSMFYLLGWLFIPVWFHPLQNLYRLSERDIKKQ